MQLIIITPDNKIFDGEVDKVTLPGGAGSFQVFQNHAPLVSTLVAGSVLYQNGKKEQTLRVGKGLVEVFENRITVLVTSPAQD